MRSKQIGIEEYYERNDYLSNSSLSNFVSFGKFGTPIYNFANFLNPTQPDSDAIEIGKAVDADLTEGQFFLDNFEFKLDKQWLVDLATELECEVILSKSKANPKPDTMATLTEKILAKGHVFKKTMTQANFDKVLTILSRANHFQYDANTTYRQYIAECDNQMVVTSEKLKMKGKFDHCNTKRKRISDLKTTGQFDKLIEDIYYGGNVNVNHKYVRQLAIYRELVYGETGEWWECELIIIGTDGKHIILRIPHAAMDVAMDQVRKDIDMLNTYRFPKDGDSVDDRPDVKDDYCVFMSYKPYQSVVAIDWNVTESARNVTQTEPDLFDII